MTGDARQGDDVLDPGESGDTEENPPGRMHRARHKARNHRVIGPFYKIAVLIVGLAVVAAGIAMLVFPGPGWVAIILGLVILASEFTWAERLLDPIKRFAEAAAERALDPKARRQNLILLSLFAVACALLAWVYYARYGLTLEPLPFFD